MDTYKVTKRHHFNPETGSCFDRTAAVSDAIRPGGHDQPVKDIDVSAFSFSKTTSRKVQSLQKKVRDLQVLLVNTNGRYWPSVQRKRSCCSKLPKQNLCDTRSRLVQTLQTVSFAASMNVVTCQSSITLDATKNSMESGR